jgi:hypothetical protein
VSFLVEEAGGNFHALYCRCRRALTEQGAQRQLIAAAGLPPQHDSLADNTVARGSAPPSAHTLPCPFDDGVAVRVSLSCVPRHLRACADRPDVEPSRMCFSCRRRHSVTDLTLDTLDGIDDAVSSGAWADSAKCVYYPEAEGPLLALSLPAGGGSSHDFAAAPKHEPSSQLPSSQPASSQLARVQQQPAEQSASPPAVAWAGAWACVLPMTACALPLGACAAMLDESTLTQPQVRTPRGVSTGGLHHARGLPT